MKQYTQHGHILKCVSTPICVCVCTYIYIHTHMYISTDIHVYTRTHGLEEIYQNLYREWRDH